MKRTILTSIAVSVFLLFLTHIPINCQATTESTSYINFDSGITIFSPLNTTYYSEPPVLNLSLNSAGLMGSLDRNIKMSYAIDGSNFESVPLKSNGEVHIISTAIGTVNLPELSDGQHTLTIKLYGLKYPYHPIQYSSYVNTVDFSTYNVDPKLNQSTTTTSPTVPEFSWLTILPLLLTIPIALIGTNKRWHRNPTKKLFSPKAETTTSSPITKPLELLQ